MKLFFLSLMFLLGACSTNTDWDSGARAQADYRQEQAQEQVEATRLQDATAGRAQVNQSQPF